MGNLYINFRKIKLCVLNFRICNRLLMLHVTRAKFSYCQIVINSDVYENYENFTIYSITVHCTMHVLSLSLSFTHTHAHTHTHVPLPCTVNTRLSFLTHWDCKPPFRIIVADGKGFIKVRIIELVVHNAVRLRVKALHMWTRKKETRHSMCCSAFLNITFSWAGPFYTPPSRLNGREIVSRI